MDSRPLLIEGKTQTNICGQLWDLGRKVVDTPVF